MNSLSQESSVFLNLIRFVACEMVVVCHFLTKYQPAIGQASFRLGSTLGGVAVLLFFVLSGLLICYSSLNKLGNPLYCFRNFFVDRFSRIYSGLVPALLITAIIAAVIYFTNYSYFVYLCSMQSTPSLLTFGMTLGMLERFPVAFFNSFLSSFGLSFPLPSVTPFGFNGLLWTLAIEWWIYMAFGWFVTGSLALIGKRKRSKAYRVLFFVVAAALGLVLAGLSQEFSSLIIVWFVGALMMLATSSEAVRSKLSSSLAAGVLATLFVLALASAIFGAYTAFAWTGQYYDVFLGLQLSVFVFVGVLLLNGNRIGRSSKWLLHKRVVNWVTLGAGFSYTLFLTHYPIVIFLNGLNLPIDRFLMFLPILLITNLTAFSIAYFTEKRHKDLAKAIKKRLGMPQN
jgi:peptidoglycan/LPS O-acetylase OafA/YrhL